MRKSSHIATSALTFLYSTAFTTNRSTAAAFVRATSSNLTPHLSTTSTTSTTTTTGRFSSSSTTTSTTVMSEPTKTTFDPLPFPPPISVPPGTSPIESQPTSNNPIDSSCVILVVGATRGIGIEFVTQCLRKGATVVATHRSNDVPSALQDLSSQYTVEDGNNNNKPRLHTLQVDLSDETSIQNAASRYQSTNLPPLTHIIHNAGIYLPQTSFDGKQRGTRAASAPVTQETLSQTFAINTIAPFLIAQNFVPLMTKRSPVLYPLLCLLSSKVGSLDDNGSGGSYAYRSSKTALNAIAKSLSIDLGDEVRVVLLHPGYVKTDMTGGKGLIDAEESVGGMLKAVECTDGNTGFRFVDYKACLIPW